MYQGLPDVDPWDEKRDARLYAGPHPVVAHPPCERWGKYWHGGPDSVRFPRKRKVKGDDAGCFEAALASVRRWGGVLEHPEASAAWRWFDLLPPSYGGGWTVADWVGGWTCRVEQGHYGHRARKGTWLYACRVSTLPSLKWGPSVSMVKMDDGYHTAEERRMAIRPPRGMSPRERADRRQLLEGRALSTGKLYCCPELMSKWERASTPPPFRDLLLSIARSSNQ